MVGHGAGQIERPQDNHAVSGDFLIGLGQRAIAATLGSQIDDQGAGAHAPDHVFGDEDRRATACRQGCGNDHVGGGKPTCHQFLLPLVKTLGLRSGVPRFRFRVLRDESDVPEAGAQAEDVLFSGRSRVVSLHDSSEPAGRADGLKTGDSGAQNRHLRGQDGACGSHEERE
jgi:hypothetical protein